jgi:hypothetical protein
MPTTSEDLVKTAMCEVWLEPFRIHSSGVQVIRCTHVGIASNRSIDTKYVAVSTFVFLTFDTTRHDTTRHTSSSSNRTQETFGNCANSAVGAFPRKGF